MRHWLGLDIGTSSLKALLVSDEGEAIGRSSVDYDEEAIRSGAVAEQDPESWIRAARTAIEECLSAGQLPDAIGLVGQVPTLVLADASGRSVRKALTWQDNRAEDQAAELARTLGAAADHVGMDLPWSPSQLPAKLKWIAQHEPASRAASRWVLSPKDFLGLRLTGVATTDAWSSKGIYDLRTARPAPRVLEECAWPLASCPPAGVPWHARGRVTGNALGLPDGVPVSVGWSDALAAMLAVGAFDEPLAFVLTGTSEMAGLSVTGTRPQAVGLYRVPRECAPLEVHYGPTQSSGATLRWLADLFGTTVEALPALAARARTAAAPVFVPYLSGERAPLWRPDVRALFAGVSSTDGAPEIVRSVLLGVYSSAADLLDIATTASGSPLTEVHVAGRGAADEHGRRMRLATLGVPVLMHPEPFTAALGAAMLGAASTEGGDLAGSSRLRQRPVRVAPAPTDFAAAPLALADYRTASRLAVEWSSR